ncbi:hypothetical protein ACFOYW_09305 [Gryllotalpicola reticulitermitis]|uniref:Secreted protein n=1 Tax=Gryllotalpicola reticulitermitis TaxID=1184153 RepID=A0ABV8Q5C8_9MICO
MFAKKALATLSVALTIVAGGVFFAAPAHALGTKNGKCTYYDSFVGTSTRRGNSSTAGQKSLCGDVKVRVKYTVTGGSAIWSPWRQASGMVVQGGVGYDVFQGQHTVTKPAVAAHPSDIIT